MRNYLVTYRTYSEWQVPIAAESAEQAKELVGDSVTPTSYITDAEGYDAEPEWFLSDVDWDSIEVSEVSEVEE